MYGPKPAPEPKPDLLTLAHHEAGHWVIALEVRSKVETIEIGWDHVSESWGRTDMGDLLAPFHRSFQFQIQEAVNDPRYRDAVERQGRMYLAGSAAASKHLGRRSWRGARDDITKVRAWLAPLSVDEPSRRTHFRRICNEAREFVAVPWNWKAIKALALEVLELGALDRDGAMKVVQRARLGNQS